MAKKLGNKRHVAGKKVSGGHTSVIEGASKLLNRFATKEWFVSVRPGEITTGKKVGGGKPFVSVKRHQNAMQKNTLTLTFKRSGVIQKIHIEVKGLENNLDTILKDMTEVIEYHWNGAELINRI